MKRTLTAVAVMTASIAALAPQLGADQSAPQAVAAALPREALANPTADARPTSAAKPEAAALRLRIVRTAWRWKQKTFASGVSRAIKPAECPDGLSNTLLVSEKLVRTDLYEGGSWSDDMGWADGWDPDQLRSTGLPPLNDSDSFCYGPRQNWCGGRPPGSNDVFIFGSSHPSGINAVFGDGSVHHINFDVDVVLFNHLGGRYDEQIVDLSAL